MAAIPRGVRVARVVGAGTTRSSNVEWKDEWPYTPGVSSRFLDILV
jgi:hypothetical protein